MISMMSSVGACTALRASTRPLSFGEAGSTGSRGTNGRAAALAAGLDGQVLMGDGHGTDFHVAADHDRARSLVDDHPRNRLRLPDRQRQHLRYERDRIVAILARNLHHDVALVEGMGQGGGVAHLLAHLAVDRVDNVRGDLEIVMVLVQHERDAVVFREGVKEFLFQPAALMDPPGVGHVFVFHGDGPFGEGIDPGMPGIGADQRREEQPSARQALGRADRAHDAVDLVALAGPRRRNGGGHENQGHVLRVPQIHQGVGRGRIAHDRHDLGHAADRRQVAGGVAGPLEPDDHAQSLDRVLFLSLDAADALERQPRGAGLGGEGRHRQDDQGSPGQGTIRAAGVVS